MFWKLPFLLAASNPAQTLRSVYTHLERPGLLHYNATDTLRFNHVPPRSIDDEHFVDKPVALYLPGLDGYGISAYQQFDDLSDQFHLWRLHVADSDRSSLWQVTMAIEKFLQNHTDVTLIGESTGGLLAVATALKHSKKLKGLVLVNPATSFDQTAWENLVPVLTALPNNNNWRRRGPQQPSPYAVLGSLMLSTIIPDRQQFGRIVETLGIEPTLQSMTQTTNTMVNCMKNMEERLPADLLRHRVEKWLGVGVPLINQRLHRIELPTLIVAGNEDQLLPSKKEAERLSNIWSHAEVLNVPNRGHFVLDDTVNLTEAILYSKIFETKKYDRISDWKLPSSTDKYIESTVQPMRNIFSPVYFSTDDSGKRWSGMNKIPKSNNSILFVANHQFVGADLSLIIADMLDELGIMTRGLAHPNLFLNARNNMNFADLDGRTPGITEKNEDTVSPLNGGFEKYGAVPVSPLNYYRLLQTGQNALLFPGGAAEALSGDKSYPLFWPDNKADFVRTAARFNATIVPLSAVGMVDSVNVIAEPQDIQNIPVLGDRARQQAMNMPAARYDRKNGDDVFGFPIATPRVPQRNYFIFGKAIETRNLDPSDKESCAKVYKQARDEVQRGINDLLRVRKDDPYGSLPQRLLYEQINGKKAPTFTVNKLN